MTLEEASRTYYNKVYRHCLKELYYNEKAAEDTTQETFAALCHSWPKLDHDNFEPWLWKTAKCASCRLRIWKSWAKPFPVCKPTFSA